jgi:dienelactone hydrolase
MHRCRRFLLLAAFCGTLPALDPALPDPLVASDGSPVRSIEAWAGRRAELLELFRREVYGRAPVERPADLVFTVVATTPGMMEGAATRKQVRIAWSGPGGKGGIDLLLFVPAKRAAPAGCFLLICNRDRDNIDPTRAQKKPFWSAEELIARGYAAAAFHVADVDPDKDDGFKDGVHGVFDPPGQPRGGDAWGTIAAWAWGASRVLDYLVTDADLDARRIAVVGHSRGGKTALWCGAQDARVALTVSNDSGCTGAAISRGKEGESIAKINAGFPHWFAANYKRWNGRENELPVDQHELIALCAPRLVYIASASEDAWADPKAEFRSCVAASPVWALHGRQGIAATAMPGVEQPVHGGSIGYHLRTGKHDLTAYDWQCFMDFADRHLPAQ